MLLLRKIVSLAVPTSVALIAFLHAHAVGSLIDGTLMPASSVAAFAEARATGNEPPGRPDRSAGSILERNAFDHITGSLQAIDGGGAAEVTIDGDPMSAPPCDGVRATVAVRGEDQGGSLAALDVHGERLLRQRGDPAQGMRVVYVDRVWLSRDGALCQTKVFGGPPALVSPEPTPGAAGR